MKRPLSVAAVILVISGLALAFLGYGVSGAACCVLAGVISFSEIKKVSGRMQILMYVVSNLCAGTALDSMHSGFPWFTILMPVLCTAATTRLLFFNRIGFTDLLWFEPLVVTVGITLYVIANVQAVSGWPGWVFPLFPLGLSLFNTISMQLGARKIRRSAGIEYEITTGSTVPTFKLPDEEGTEIDLADFKGKRNLLLLFVRGDWCPTCHIMLRTYEKNRMRFMEKDVMLLAIGPDPVGVNKKMVQTLGLEYRILSDEKQEIVRRFGVQAHEAGTDAKNEMGTPMPASFLVDKNGVVRYTSRADRAGDFLNPEKIFEVLLALN
jgi:peroxiredoxin